jgi:peptide deformylase
MAIRPIVRTGAASLFERSEPVQHFGGMALQDLLADMRDTMQALQGVGLAAPQIGVNLRVVIFGVQLQNTRYPDAGAVPETVLINPTIVALDEVTESAWEGCLSLPGMLGLVPRFQNIRYRGLDEQGNPIDRTASGFHARVVQHECDHLDGVLYPMRMLDMSKFGYKEELFPDKVFQDE